MKLEVGDYIRTEKGEIKKVFQYNEQEDNLVWCTLNCYATIKSSIVKSSKKIKDLVNVGDFIDGMRVIAKDSDNRLYVAEDLGQPYDREFYNGYFEYTLLDERYKIKTILTKEQYENNCYRIEE